MAGYEEQKRQHAVRSGRGNALRAAVLTAAFSWMVAGCSMVPDEINPVVWYETVEDAVSGEDEETVVISDAERSVPGEDEPFPNLGSVPGQAPATENRARREAVAEGLVADLSNARYTDETVREETADSVAATEGPATRREIAEAMRRSAGPVESTNQGTAGGPASTRDEVAAEMRGDLTAARASPSAPERTQPASRRETSVAAAPTRGTADRRDVTAGTTATVGIPDIAVPDSPERTTPAAAGTASPPPAEREVAAAPVPTPPAYTRPARTAPPPGSPRYSQPGATVAQAPPAAGAGSYDDVFTSFFAASGRAPGSLRQPAATNAPASRPTAFAGAPQARRGALAGGVNGYPQLGRQPAAVITFASSSARLSGEDLQVVREVADAYKSRGGTLRVVGHASSRTVVNDPVKHKQVNLKVSLERARAVADALQQRGVPADSIVVAAVSDTRPLYSEATPLGEAANRRAEIYFE